MPASSPELPVQVVVLHDLVDVGDANLILAFHAGSGAGELKIRS